MNLNKYIWRYKRDFIISIFFNFLRSFPFVGVTYIFGVILDTLNQGILNDQIETKKILNQTYILLALGVITYVVIFAQQYTSARFNEVASRDIRSDVFKALQLQSHKYFDEENTGDLTSKAIQDVANIINYYQVFTQSVGLMIGRFILTITILAYIHINLAIIGLIAVPIMFLVLQIFQKKYTPLQFQSRQKYGEMAGIITENIDSSILTKIFNIKERNIKQLDETMIELKEINIKSQKMQAALNVQGRFLTNLVVAIFFLYGGYQFFNGELSMGGVITAVLLGQNLSGPIQLWSVISIFRSTYKASEKRLGRILASTPHIQNPDDGIKPNWGTMNGEIIFEDVNFAYGDRDVLKGINLKIPAEGKIAILGSSGSGKSALINLIPRFYDAKKGTIMIDGEDISMYDIYALRKMIGFVDQETFLFSKTVRENISFGKPDAELDEVVKVSKIAQIHDFIESLPDKYDTIIGERGVNLSGGQRQRLAIARALLFNPKIVIFDDSLSAVDIKTEYKIQEALDALLKNRTVIFVTQRLSTVTSTDSNIIMYGGQILEQGSHDELMRNNSTYSRLFETQVDGILDLAMINGQSMEVVN